MNKRKDMNTRRNYGIVEVCYDCPGTREITENCDLGKDAYHEIYNCCAWKNTINNDLEKLARGIEPLTFPILKKIIKRK